jgi:hypothetical protein
MYSPANNASPLCDPQTSELRTALQTAEADVVASTARAAGLEDRVAKLSQDLEAGADRGSGIGVSAVNKKMYGAVRKRVAVTKPVTQTHTDTHAHTHTHSHAHTLQSLPTFVTAGGPVQEPKRSSVPSLLPRTGSSLYLRCTSHRIPRRLTQPLTRSFPRSILNLCPSLHSGIDECK